MGPNTITCQKRGSVLRCYATGMWWISRAAAAAAAGGGGVGGVMEVVDRHETSLGSSGSFRIL